jgi:competence protein ComEA
MDRIRELVYQIRDNKKMLKMAAAIIVIIAAVLLFEMKENNDTISISEADKQSDMTKNSEASLEKASIYVDVSGEVKSPGVYKVDKDSRIFEAIDQAGGLTQKADTTGINQAELVKDGQKILVPSKVQAGSTSSASSGIQQGSSTGNGNDLISINSAGSSDLQRIPGVGPVMAEKIISYREENGGFKALDDLKNVSGIGDKTFAKMKKMIRL